MISTDISRVDVERPQLEALVSLFINCELAHVGVGDWDWGGRVYFTAAKPGHEPGLTKSSIKKESLNGQTVTS